MSQYIVVKEKSKTLIPKVVKYNLKKDRLIANHPQDRNAECMICEVVEQLNPGMNENRESL